MQEKQQKTTAMIIVRDHEGLNLGNGKETRKEGMKWKDTIRVLQDFVSQNYFV